MVRRKLSRAEWEGSAYKRKTAKPERKWINKHTGVTGATAQAVLHPKKKPHPSRIEPTNRNFYGDDSIKRKKRQIGLGFRYDRK